MSAEPDSRDEVPAGTALTASAPEGPTLEALRQARARRMAMHRRGLPFAILAAAVVVVFAARAQPGIGLHGSSLGVTAALAGFVAGALGLRGTLIVGRTSARAGRSMLALLLVSSAVLVWLQPEGPGFVGFVLAIVFIASRRLIAGRVGIFLMFTGCLAVLVLAVIIGSTGHHERWLDLAVSVIPVVIAFVVTMLSWWFREHEAQTERLLIELEETRGAELRAAALAERQRVARDMHDVLAHTLSGLAVQLEGARLLARSDPADDRLEGVLARAHQLASAGLSEARQAIGMLRGDELPGIPRLASLATDFEADTGVPCPFTTTGQPRELGSAARLTLYRVTQEALTNVRKHARPHRVEVRLDYQPAEVLLAVEDTCGDGRGAPRADGGAPRADGGGYGLTGMRERAELLGGTLSAGPTEAGFLVVLRVPE
jgi:signal transduction histidine kinase